MRLAFGGKAGGPAQFLLIQTTCQAIGQMLAQLPHGQARAIGLQAPIGKEQALPGRTVFIRKQCTVEMDWAL